MPRKPDIQKISHSSLSGVEPLRIGIVISRFNEEIGIGELDAALEELTAVGIARGMITLVSVPGALEIPLTLQRMAQTGRFDALIALGAVIRGETYHFEVVANDACHGLMSVQLETGIPIANGILTTNDDDQAIARMRDKGRDCARCAVEMALLMNTIGTLD